MTRKERIRLEVFHNTEGAEFPGQPDKLDKDLEAQGLITISAGRGPGRMWRRYELTDKGRTALLAEVTE